MTYSKYTCIRTFINKFQFIFSLSANLFYFIFITTFNRWFSTHLLSRPVHCLSTEIRPLSAHPILSWPQIYAFTIKTSASYLEKSLWASRLLITMLEIHGNFVSFSCPPSWLLFSKPTLTVSFGKVLLSIIFSLITSWKLFLDGEITLTTNEIIDLV